MEQEFTCHRCGKVYPVLPIAPGYGKDDQDNKICYACCGEIDKDNMKAWESYTLYLTSELEDGGKKKWYASNWPGTLRLPIHHEPVRGRHNWCGVRYDVWFKCNDEEWHGTQFGDNTQILHCKKLKPAK